MLSSSNGSCKMTLNEPNNPKGQGPKSIRKKIGNGQKFMQSYPIVFPPNKREMRIYIIDKGSRKTHKVKQTKSFLQSGGHS